MTVTIERRPTHYTDAEIKEGLTVLALCSGNTRRAASETEARGKRIPETTLREWKTKRYTREYQQIAETELPKVYAAVAERCEDLAFQQADVEEQLLNRLQESIADLDSRDVATALRNVGVTKAVNIDKASLVRGRPTEIRESRTMGDVLKALQRIPGIVRVNADVEGTATESLPESTHEARTSAS